MRRVLQELDLIVHVVIVPSVQLVLDIFNAIWRRYVETRKNVICINSELRVYYIAIYLANMFSPLNMCIKYFHINQKLPQDVFFPQNVGISIALAMLPLSYECA